MEMILKKRVDLRQNNLLATDEFATFILDLVDI